MTDTMTSQNIILSSWDTLYTTVDFSTTSCKAIEMSSSTRQGTVGTLGVDGRYYRVDLWRENTSQNQEFSSVNTGFFKTHM
jgi:hypothetical protein